MSQSYSASKCNSLHGHTTWTYMYISTMTLKTFFYCAMQRVLRANDYAYLVHAIFFAQEENCSFGSEIFWFICTNVFRLDLCKALPVCWTCRNKQALQTINIWYKFLKVQISLYSSFNTCNIKYLGLFNLNPSNKFLLDLSLQCVRFFRKTFPWIKMPTDNTETQKMFRRCMCLNLMDKIKVKQKCL